MQHLQNPIDSRTATTVAQQKFISSQENAHGTLAA